MQWERKGPSGPAKWRKAGLVLLGLGVIVLAVAIAVTLTIGTVLAPTLMLASIMINSVSIIFLRKSKKN